MRASTMTFGKNRVGRQYQRHAHAFQFIDNTDRQWNRSDKPLKSGQPVLDEIVESPPQRFLLDGDFRLHPAKKALLVGRDPVTGDMDQLMNDPPHGRRKFFRFHPVFTAVGQAVHVTNNKFIHLRPNKCAVEIKKNRLDRRPAILRCHALVPIFNCIITLHTRSLLPQRPGPSNSLSERSSLTNQIFVGKSLVGLNKPGSTYG